MMINQLQKLFSIILLFSILYCLMFVQNVWAQQGRSNADGFADVPWGSNREQTTSILQKKGFILTTKKAESFFDADLYRGNFAGETADMYFHYGGKDFLEGGNAYLIGYKGQGTDIAKVGYFAVIKLMKAKYGECENEGIIGQGEGIVCSWYNLSANTPSPGVVTINVTCGPIPDHTSPGFSKGTTGVMINYHYKKVDQGGI